MVFRSTSTCSEFEKNKAVRYIDSRLQVHGLPPGNYEFLVIELAIPSFITITITAEGIRLETVLKVEPI